MSFLIYEKNNSICEELCDEIICKFESENDKSDGKTIGGVQKNVKDTTDFVIPTNCNSWENIHKFLLKELTRNLETYCDNYICFEIDNNNSKNNNSKYKPINKNNIIFHKFMVQRYIKNKGKYVYHNDSYIDLENNQYRVITYLWYLNTVEEGGETEFWGNYRIKPEKGKLILFPSSWTFSHCGKTPVSSNKYIITGWIYQKIN